MDTPLYSTESIPEDFEAPGGAAWAEFRKTATTRALRIEGPFRVVTSETENEPFYCEDGWLAIDARGYPYAIADDEFAQIYKPIAEGAETRKPTIEQELHEAKNHIEALLRRDKVSATDIVTDETAARKWLSER